MVFDRTTIDCETATRLVRGICGRPLAVRRIRRLHGGMVNSVLELETDGEPRFLVAKLNAEVGHAAFQREHDVLLWHRENSPLPMPHPWGCDLSGRFFPGSCLLLERLPGDNLAEARLSPAERESIEREMARILGRVHAIHRQTYGSALDPPERGARHWLDIFEPRVRREYEKTSTRYPPQTRARIERILERLPDLLPESGEPTLVHGDLWSTNIIVHRDAAGRPRISGFVDGGADFADVEYELAYLLVFHTVGPAFFEEYRRVHAIRPGFEYRCRIYWLHTMLVHVRAFGDAHYVRAVNELAAWITQHFGIPDGSTGPA